MKKIDKNQWIVIGIIIGVFVFFVIIFFLAFGRSKRVVCSMKSDQSKNGYVLETKYVIRANGDNVKKVSITENITSEKKELLEKFEKQFNDQYSYNKKTYGGYTYKVVKKKDKVTSDVTIDYKKFDMKKFIANNEAMKKYTKNDQLTLSGAKELYESTGAVCK